jgi:hypothetical protein
VVAVATVAVTVGFWIPTTTGAGAALLVVAATPVTVGD